MTTNNLSEIKSKYEMELKYLCDSYYYGANLVRILPFLLIALLVIIGCVYLGTFGLALLGVLIVAVPVYLANNVKFNSDKPLTAQRAYRVCVIMTALIYIHNDKFVDEKSLPKVHRYNNLGLYLQFIQIYPNYESEKLARLSSLDIPDSCYGWRDMK
jgi:hypothetical protein